MLQVCSAYEIKIVLKDYFYTLRLHLIECVFSLIVCFINMLQIKIYACFLVYFVVN